MTLLMTLAACYPDRFALFPWAPTGRETVVVMGSKVMVVDMMTVLVVVVLNSVSEVVLDSVDVVSVV